LAQIFASTGCPDFALPSPVICNKLKECATVRRHLVFNGRYVKDYATGRRLLEFDGQYVKDYESGRRLMTVSGMVPEALVAIAR
jgi:hypothetical protein